MDYRKTKNDDIVDVLVAVYKMDKESVLKMGRKELIGVHKAWVATESSDVTKAENDSIKFPQSDDYIEFDVSEEKVEDLGNPNDMEKPKMGDVEWHDYVMGLFTEDEVIDGSPTVSGLRRVTEACLGTIVDSGPIHVDIRSSDPEDLYVCVTYTVQVVLDDSFGQTVTQREVASVWFRELGDGKCRGSIERDFSIYAEANASTRAEGRTLRKLLRLKNTIAHEERCNDISITTVQSASSDFNEDENIGSNQINFLDSKCRQLDINLLKFINSGDGKYKSIKDITRGTAQNMAQTISGFQTNVDSIPANLVGYDEDWRKR